MRLVLRPIAPHARLILGERAMAHLDFGDIDGRLRRWRLLLDIKLHHKQQMVIAGAIASLTIVVVAAAMMTQL
jgi:hypothetical protein